MFYQYGIILVTIVSVTSALPSIDTGCTCQRIMAPVCGSDGKTYNNECLFNCARTVNTELIIQNYGRCEEKQCFCNYNYSPVCGTDGKTYDNECFLRCVKIKSPKLDVRHPGICNNKENDELQEKEAEPSKNFIKIDKTNVTTFDVAEYGNPDSSKKKQDEEVQEKEVKETQTAESPKDSDTVNVGLLPKTKPCRCKKVLNKVCGTDGVTYANACLLNCASHIYGREINVLSSGPCKSVENGNPDSSKEKQDEVVQEKEVKETQVTESPKDSDTVNVAYLPNTKPCRCKKVLNKVCGTDGVTYINACLLNCASHIYGLEINVLRTGPCKSVENGNPDSKQDEAVQEKEVKKTQATESPKDSDTVNVAYLPFTKPCRCKNVLNKVCGTDGVTYANACMLNVASRMYGREINVLKSGPCTSVEQVNPISCTCPHNYQPVCGVNEVTYENACVLRCFGIEMLRAGPCQHSLIQLRIHFTTS